jgi:hypothetical protein
MKKLSANGIIAFRSKSAKSKKLFVQALQNPKEPTASSGGGNYWVSCLTALSKSFRDDNTKPISDKIGELTAKMEGTKFTLTKDMYRRNIEILSKYEGFDLGKWKRLKKMTFIHQYKSYYTITLKGMNINVPPHQVFIWQKDGAEHVGAIWFVAKKGGYKKEELGVFTELLFNYLKKHYGKKYELNEKSCIAVDVVSNFDLSYAQLDGGAVPKILQLTLNEIRDLI